MDVAAAPSRPWISRASWARRCQTRPVDDTVTFALGDLVEYVGEGDGELDVWQGHPGRLVFNDIGHVEVGVHWAVGPTWSLPRADLGAVSPEVFLDRLERIARGLHPVRDEVISGYFIDATQSCAVGNGVLASRLCRLPLARVRTVRDQRAVLLAESRWLRRRLEADLSVVYYAEVSSAYLDAVRARIDQVAPALARSTATSRHYRRHSPRPWLRRWLWRVRLAARSLGLRLYAKWLTR